MDPNKNQNLTPEEELDALLAQFLAEPDPVPESAPAVAQQEYDLPEPEVVADPPAAADVPGEESDLSQEPADGQPQPPAFMTLEEELEQIIREMKSLPPEPEEENPEEDEPFLEPEVREAFDGGKTLDKIFAEEDTLAPMPSEMEDAPQEDPQATALPSEEPSEIPDPEPQHKRLPKKTGTYGLFGLPHIVVTGIWLAIAVFIGATIGRVIWFAASDVLAFGREDRTVTLTITKEDDLEAITEKLHATGLIEYPDLFKLYAGISDAMEKIAPGTYELNTLYDYHALVQMMSTTANRVTIKVMIPEGYTCAQIFSLLQEKGVCSAADLEAASVSGELGDYWFLEDLPRDSKYCLEGYLYPDTYEFYLDDSPTRVLNKFLTNFHNRLSDNIQEKLDALNATLSEMMAKNGFTQAYISTHQITMREVVIIASMIEKEMAAVSESYNIASVIYNRLTNPNTPYLNIDAALVYITGHSVLTQEDKALDSPYNTYLYKGLIPGPISNPGRFSFDAALNPAATGYYYYALDPEANRHHFSQTYDEHLAFLESLKKED